MTRNESRARDLLDPGGSLTATERLRLLSDFFRSGGFPGAAEDIDELQSMIAGARGRWHEVVTPEQLHHLGLALELAGPAWVHHHEMHEQTLSLQNLVLPGDFPDEGESEGDVDLSALI